MSDQNRGELKKQPNERLRTHRLRKNWTQVYVATMIGTSHVEVSRWETGAAVPSLYFRDRLCELFGSTPEALGLLSPVETSSSHAEDLASVLWNVPYPRNPYFTGREEILTLLYQALHAHPASLAQAQAISGLGGIGKTQTALEYAYRYRDKYQAVFWIKADTAENLRSDLAALASLLQLPENNTHDQERILEAVNRWLKTRRDWLLILDNVEDFTNLKSLFALQSGHLLLTTRSQVTGTLARRLDLGKWEPQESALFLLRRAKRLLPGMSLAEAQDAERVIAGELAQELDGLPLALDQAGAYIEETGCSLSDYLVRYQGQRTVLLARRGEMGADHPHSLLTTLAMACSRAAQTNPAALKLLRFCAFLHPDAIPEDLFMAGASTSGPEIQSVVEDPLALDATVATLRHYSLLQRNPEEKTLTIHRLVQVVLREQMCETEQRQWATRAVEAIAGAVPLMEEVTNGSMWEQGKRYVSQALMGVSLIEQWQLRSAQAEQLLNWVGAFFIELWQLPQAISRLLQALQIGISLRGPEDPLVCEYMSHLALAYTRQREYAQAEQLLREVLRIQKNVLGTQHPEVAMCLNNLGYLYNSQGYYTRAEPLLQEALALFEKNVGAEHPNVAMCLNNLGYLYHGQGRYAEAEACYLQVVHLCEKILGSAHPRVAIGLVNLAKTYRERGLLAQAEPVYQRALMIRENTLGTEHPDVAQSLQELAMLYTHQKRFEEALSMCQRALAIRERHFGKEHPDTIATSTLYADLLRRKDAFSLQ